MICSSEIHISMACQQQKFFFFTTVGKILIGRCLGALPSTVPSTIDGIPEAEFEEIMNRNRTVSSSAITRAVSDAAANDYASAIETLVTAISLIRQSRVANDDRCKVLISSLQVAVLFHECVIAFIVLISNCLLLIVDYMHNFFPRDDCGASPA